MPAKLLGREAVGFEVVHEVERVIITQSAEGLGDKRCRPNESMHTLLVYYGAAPDCIGINRDNTSDRTSYRRGGGDEYFNKYFQKSFKYFSL